MMRKKICYGVILLHDWTGKLDQRSTSQFSQHREVLLILQKQTGITHSGNENSTHQLLVKVLLTSDDEITIVK